MELVWMSFKVPRHLIPPLTDWVTVCYLCVGEETTIPYHHPLARSFLWWPSSVSTTKHSTEVNAELAVFTWVTLRSYYYGCVALRSTFVSWLTLALWLHFVINERPTDHHDETTSSYIIPVPHAMNQLYTDWGSYSSHVKEWINKLRCLNFIRDHQVAKVKHMIRSTYIPRNAKGKLQCIVIMRKLQQSVSNYYFHPQFKWRKLLNNREFLDQLYKSEGLAVCERSELKVKIKKWGRMNKLRYSTFFL